MSSIILTKDEKFCPVKKTIRIDYQVKAKQHKFTDFAK